MEHAQVSSGLAASGPLQGLGMCRESEGEEEEGEKGSEHGVGFGEVTKKALSVL